MSSDLKLEILELLRSKGPRFRRNIETYIAAQPSEFQHISAILDELVAEGKVEEVSDVPDLFQVVRPKKTYWPKGQPQP